MISPWTISKTVPMVDHWVPIAMASIGAASAILDTMGADDAADQAAEAYGKEKAATETSAVIAQNALVESASTAAQTKQASTFVVEQQSDATDYC
jgi:hypothetical protein